MIYWSMLIKYVVGIMKDMMDMAILMGLVGDQIPISAQVVFNCGCL